MPFDESRILLATARRRRDASARRRRRRGLGRPAALLARRLAARVRLGRDAAGGTSGSRTPTARTRARCSTEPHDHAEPTWAPGPAVVRVVARRIGDRAVPQRGRLRPARRGRRPGEARRAGDGRRASSRRVGTTRSTGAPHGIVAVRSGARTPPAVTVDRSRTRGARRVLARGAPAGIERDAGRARGRSRGRAASATVHGLLYRPRESALGAGHRAADARARARRADRSGDRRLAAARRRTSSSAAGRCCARTIAARPASGASTRRRCAAAGVSSTSSTPSAGIRAAAKRGWCDPDRVAIMGGSAGGLTDVARVRAARRARARRASALFGVTDLFDLAETTHRLESRYLDWLVGALPARRRPLPRPLAGDARRARSGCRCSCCRATRTRSCRPRRRSRWSTRSAARGGTVEHHVYEGEGHGWSRPETVTDELERVEAFLDPMGAASR